MEIHIESRNKAGDYFRQGKEFLAAAWRCFSNEDGSIVTNQGFYQLSAPCVVNAAFSCEMFLKALLKKMDIPYNQKTEGHNIYMLYKKLPSDVQNTIAKRCGNKDNPTVFESILKRHNKDFVDIRYYIENQGWAEMSPMEMIAIAQNLSVTTKYLLTTWGIEEK